MPTVYIAEDQKAVSQGMERILAELGHVTRTFDDGLEAYAAVFEEPPDLLVLDVLMPSLNGLALARLVKFNEDLKHVPILIVSSVTSDVEAQARQARVDGILCKPFNGPAFMDEVERLLEPAEVVELATTA